MDTNNLPPTQPVTNPQVSQNNDLSSNNSGKNTLLALTSLLILGGVVGLTLFLYLQNKGTRTIQTAKNSEEPTKEEQKTDEQLTTIPTLTQNEQNKMYGNVVCRRFTSIEEALKTPSIACELDLSNNNISSLPSTIGKLNNLTSIQLKGNKFTKIPDELLPLTKLTSIDLSDNNISSINESIILTLPELQNINLAGNQAIDKATIEKLSKITDFVRAEIKIKSSKKK